MPKFPSKGPPRTHRGKTGTHVVRFGSAGRTRTFTGHFLDPRNIRETLQYIFRPSGTTRGKPNPAVRVGTKVNVWFNVLVLEDQLREMAEQVPWVGQHAGYITAEEGIPRAQQIVREMGLVATGVLINSFVAKYTGRGAELENVAPHAYFVHYGTGWGTNSPNIAFGSPYFPHVGSILEWLRAKVNPGATSWDAQRVARKIQQDGTPATRFMDRIRDALAQMYKINVVIQFEAWLRRTGQWPGGGGGGGGGGRGGNTPPSGGSRSGNSPRFGQRGPRMRRGPGGHMRGGGSQGGQ